MLLLFRFLPRIAAGPQTEVRRRLLVGLTPPALEADAGGQRERTLRVNRPELLKVAMPTAFGESLIYPPFS